MDLFVFIIWGLGGVLVIIVGIMLVCLVVCWEGLGVVLML